MMGSEACRICSMATAAGVPVFGDEGHRLYLQSKIRKYLYITVSMEDKLPKIICNKCCTKLEAIHRFAMMAIKNQDKFNKTTTATDINVLGSSENKGLLHTYLTKGTLEGPEEMEVTLDPMIFLQYAIDDSESESGHEDVSDADSLAPVANQQENEDCTTNNNESKCSVCTKAFQSESALHNHEWCHTTKSNRVVLNNHSNFYSKAEQDEVCLEQENSDDRGSIGKFTCPICNKVISTKGNLKVHLETHRPKGKYACDICGRIFKTQCNLHRHKEYHSGIQFTCNVCGRVYPTNSTLRAHSITHSDLRPHKCPLCDKTFKRNQDLKFHINQHTGARPYKCPYCPKAFASSGNCFSHRKRMHPMEVERDRERAAKIMR